MAQALLTRQLAARGIRADVWSAGLLPGGWPLPPETQVALVRRGIDRPAVEAFRSCEITVGAVERAELVIGMAREHVREVVVRVPAAWERTFTLKELVRRGGATSRRADEALSDWLARAAQGRQRSDLLGSSADDDVDDPIGGAPADFERTATEIEALCASLASLLWPYDQPGPPNSERH